MNAIIVTSNTNSNTSTIVTQTRLGHPIPNLQCLDSPSHGQHLRQSKYQDDYRQNIFRTGPCLIYNCHGLTFAARRTTIIDSQAVHRILQDDQYKEIPRKEALPGDIVVYIARGTSDIDHSGIVIEGPNDLGLPTVVSKWGGYGEVVHLESHCPYPDTIVKYYRIEK